MVFINHNLYSYFDLILFFPFNSEKTSPCSTHLFCCCYHHCLFKFSERAENCATRAVCLCFSLCFFRSVTWDAIWGDSPQSIGSFKHNPKPTDSMRVTPSLLMTASLVSLTCTHTSSMHTCMWRRAQICAYA